MTSGIDIEKTALRSRMVGGLRADDDGAAALDALADDYERRTRAELEASLPIAA